MRIFKSVCALLIGAVSLQASADYTLPAYEKTTLSNGLTVYLMEQKEVPLIDVSVVVKVGAIEDKAHAGLTSFTVDNLVLGTKSLDKKSLDQKLDFIGANIFGRTNHEFTTIGASFAAKDQDTVLPILRDLVLTPRMDAEEFDKLKKRTLLNLEQEKESPRMVISRYFNRQLFGSQGYGAEVTGNANSIANISLEQLKSHHQHWYQPDNAAVIVVGDFNQKDMKAQLNKLFGTWKKTASVTPSKVAKTKAPTQSNVVIVNKDNAGESTFLIGGLGITRDNPDIVGLSVINTILGARFTSWLNDELRVNAGLTYGARSRFTSYSNDGSFAISTFTKTETTVEAIDLALKTYARLWEKGIDQQTLDSAKAYVKGQFPPNFETSTDLAGLLVDMYGYQFDENYINTFEQQVNSLTLEKTKSLIKQYFPKENLQFVVVGKASEIQDKLSKYGRVKTVQIEDAGFAVN
ncbi:M16 family metallopeptidase [Thalassotalea fusca]